MVTILLWKIFLSLFVVFVVLGYIVKEMYGNADTYSEQCPKKFTVVFGVLVIVTILSFVAAILFSIWTLF